jgi:hypothetical protein
MRFFCKYTAILFFKTKIKHQFYVNLLEWILNRAKKESHQFPDGFLLDFF